MVKTYRPILRQLEQMAAQRGLKQEFDPDLLVETCRNLYDLSAGNYSLASAFVIHGQTGTIRIIQNLEVEVAEQILERFDIAARVQQKIERSPRPSKVELESLVKGAVQQLLNHYAKGLHIFPTLIVGVDSKKDAEPVNFQIKIRPSGSVVSYNPQYPFKGNYVPVFARMLDLVTPTAAVPSS